jgi:tetratricopeptide (TPR) repeat protein
MQDSDLSALLDGAQRDLERGDFTAAESTCLHALSAQERHPRALGLLGQALFSQGRHEEAVRIFNALTVMEPRVIQHWQNLAAALRPLKQYDLAIAAFDRALRIAPPSAALLYNLGVLQMERCDYNAAYLALRDAVKLAPGDATFRWGFAQCCYDILALEESLDCLQNWQSFSGLNTDLTVRIIFLLVMMGAADKAWPAIEKLREFPPRTGPAAVGFASILERLHLLDEARAIVKTLDSDRSLDTNPEKLLISGVLAERSGQREAARRDLRMALDHHTQFVHRYHLLYRLAKVEDSLGNFAEAHAVAAEAHRSQLEFIAQAMGRTPQQESRILARAARGCDPADVATWSTRQPAMEESPVFVLGFPRSGTTLLEQVLDAHPALKSMDEQPFMLRAQEDMIARGAQYPDGLGRLSERDLQEVRERYWQMVRTQITLRPGQRLVDKNPLNMLVLPCIRRLFPNARLILAIRHPCDVLLSCFMQNFRAPELALLCRDLQTLAGAYDRAFAFWYSQCPLLQPSIYELRYDELTSQFGAEVAKLSDFLQLPLHEAMLEPAAHARAKGFVSTPSYAQILEPVHQKSVGRWHHYARHFEPLMPILNPWITRLGYSVTAA